MAHILSISKNKGYGYGVSIFDNKMQRIERNSRPLSWEEVQDMVNVFHRRYRNGKIANKTTRLLLEEK